MKQNRRKKTRMVSKMEKDDYGGKQLNHIDDRNTVERAIALLREIILFIIFYVLPLPIGFAGAAKLAEHGLPRVELTMVLVGILWVFSYQFAKQCSWLKTSAVSNVSNEPEIPSWPAILFLIIWVWIFIRPQKQSK